MEPDFLKDGKKTKLFYSQDLSSNSPYCLLYNSHDVSSEIWYWINPQSPDRDFLCTHFFYAWYCIDILKKKSVLVIHGSERLQHGLQMINLKKKKDSVFHSEKKIVTSLEIVSQIYLLYL